jgi:hypothetical protein
MTTSTTTTHLARDGHAKAAVAAPEAALSPDPFGCVPAAGRRDAIRARLGARLDDLGRDPDQAGCELATRSREDVDPRRRKVERRGCQPRLQRLIRGEECGRWRRRDPAGQQRPRARLCACRDAPPGAPPTKTLPMPLYTPLKPPAWMKPACDWSRVLSVSIGKKRRSTDRPARAPPLVEERD